MPICLERGTDSVLINLPLQKNELQNSSIISIKLMVFFLVGNGNLRNDWFD